MKISKNLNVLFRLILIPGVILMLLLLFVKGPSWLSSWFNKNQKISAPVSSFGIIIPKGYTVHGIDVSKHQGKIDWERVSQMKKDGIRISFTFIKATEGITRQDNKFETNWKQAGRNDILRGAYHFYYPSRDADKQADNFIRMVKLSKGDLPPVVDIEYSNGRSAKTICEGLKAFCNRLEHEYSVKPIIYTNINFFNTYLKDSFDDYPLWIAGYYEHERFYNEFNTRWIIWQHSEQGKVDGIAGKVDFNVFRGSIENFRSMCLQ